MITSDCDHETFLIIYFLPFQSQGEPSIEELVEKMSQSLNISPTQNQSNSTSSQCFVPYHVYVMNEGDAVKESVESSNDYEMQLYQDYVDREGAIQGIFLISLGLFKSRLVFCGVYSR